MRLSGAPGQNWTLKEASITYFIDTDWLAQHGRPFSALAESYLCPQHQGGAASATLQEITSTIRDCCANGTDFLSPRLPLLELIFRLLLSGGNQPAAAEELAQQLSQLRGAPVYPKTVDQLLSAEPRFYGVRNKVQEAAPEQA